MEIRDRGVSPRDGSGRRSSRPPPQVVTFEAVEDAVDQLEAVVDLDDRLVAPPPQRGAPAVAREPRDVP